MDCKHCDCVNYENVDITKGLCLRCGGFVPFDGGACPAFSPKPKCRLCAHYAAGTEEGLGLCTGLDDGGHWISGGMNAVTCSAFEKAEA